MVNQQENIKISKDMYFHNIDKILEFLTPNKNKYLNIYGIPRGGLLPAFLFSNKFNIPMIFEVKKISHLTLICDDIVDSGHTIDILYDTIMGDNKDRLPQLPDFITILSKMKNNELTQPYITYCPLYLNKTDPWVDFFYDPKY